MMVGKRASLAAAVGLLGLCASSAVAQIRITEYMYTGPDGEFVELTNVGGAAVDMTGWSYDDNSNTPGSFDLSAFGSVAPGESVIITDATEAAFRTAWGLALSVKIIGGSGGVAALGRNDTINIWDASNVLVDQLQFGDQDFPGSIRTQNPSGWVCAAGLGANDAYEWVLSAVADVQNSFLSAGGAVGSPGAFVLFNCGATPTGACCTTGVCSDPVTQVDCENGGGVYEGDGTDCLTTSCPAPTDGDVRITEYMYSGSGAEFIEFTNFDNVPVNMTGWSFDDDSQIPGTVSLSGLGTLLPGQSGLLVEGPAASFIADWGLVGVPVVGNNGAGLGRNDEINLYNASGTLKDRLTYGDQNFPGTIRTQNISGWPCDEAAGANDIFQWQFSHVGDSQGSVASSQGDVGSPGVYVAVSCNAIPTGACCSVGLCSDVTYTQCTQAGGSYQGDGTDCGSTNCPAPADGDVRITEYMYTGTGGEYVEFTNLDANPVDMTGWSYDDDSNLPGAVDLSAFGVVLPGQSVILAEDPDATFIADWSLAGIVVIGSNTVNLGRADQINLYDGNGVLKDRLTYGDQVFPGTIRTNGFAGWPCRDAVGADNIFLWRLASVGDSQNSYASANGDIGSPGFYAEFHCIGACCTNGACTADVTPTDCTAGGGTYVGDGTTCEGDADGDGTDETCGDECPQDPNKLAPGQCGCGTPDTDTDGDGTADCNDGCPNDPGKIDPGICGCGTPDDDIDGDGTADCEDGCPNDPNKINPGQCGCGAPDDDSDGDGTADCNDGCPNDPNKIAPGNCGCGVAETGDSDGDGIDDCNDLCPGVDDAVFAPGCVGAIPTVSEWGLVVLGLMLLVAGKLAFTRREALS